MIYRVTKNGDNIITTRSYKHAVKEYDHAIYNGKNGDIIRLFVKKDGGSSWEEARKDWM